LKKIWWALVAIAVVVSSAAGLYYAHTPTSKEECVPSGGEEYWLNNYTPAHSLGYEEEDWWVTYPKMHPNYSEPVEHPDWIIEHLHHHPMLILVHTTTCSYCSIQEEHISAVLPQYRDNITYIDILADTQDGYERGQDVFVAYDPNDGAHYVPLTVYITLCEANGKVFVAWHGIEGVTSEEWIESHIEDAIYYFEKNNNSWEGH